MPQNFEYLLDRTDPLDVQESINACTLALEKGKNELVRKWLGDPGKLACSEEMGDAIKPFDSELALAVYLRAQAPHKVIRCYAETGQFDKIVHHSQTIGYKQEDYLFLLQSILSGKETADQGLKLAAKLLEIKNKGGERVCDAIAVVDEFVKAKLNRTGIELLTKFVLNNDDESGANLQTRLFELLFSESSEEAKELLESNRYSHYDRKRIAQLCENHGLVRLALENFKSFNDVKRLFASSEMAVLMETERDWLQLYLQSFSLNEIIVCLEKFCTAHADKKTALAKLVLELFRSKFSDQKTVEALADLKLDRELTNACRAGHFDRENVQLLLRLKNAQLWSNFLTSGISTRQYFLEEVASIAVTDVEAISCLVKALITASLSTDLLAILENLLIDIKLDDGSLKNLFLLTAIKLADSSNAKSRFMDYAMRLDGYSIDVGEVAEAHDLFEEAFAIYRKLGDNKLAMKLLLEKIGDLERARRFAQEINDPAIAAMLPRQRSLHEMIENEDAQQERVATVVEFSPEQSKADNPSPPLQLHPVDTLKLSDTIESPFRNEVLLPALKSPVFEMKQKKKLPPIKSSKPNIVKPEKVVPLSTHPQAKSAGYELAELASKVKIKQNSRRVLQMNSEDVKNWLKDIGLDRYSDRFARYNGQMLDNLYSLHFSAPEFFCQSVASKLDADLDNVILFFGGLCKLYGDER